MELNLLVFCYLLGSVTFIVGLKMLSNPVSARNGNLVAAAGMFVAIMGTIFLYEDEGKKLGNYGWIFAALVIGTIVGTLMAKRVKMTAMPEMVSLFNGMGGACAALISVIEFRHLIHGYDPATYASTGYSFFSSLGLIPLSSDSIIVLNLKVINNPHLNSKQAPIITCILNSKIISYRSYF